MLARIVKASAYPHLPGMTGTRLFSRAIVRLSPRDESEDVAGFLQGLVTNDITGTLPVWTGLLTAQGTVLFDFIAWRDNRDILLDCEAEAAEALVKRLTLYRLRRAIDITRDDGLAVHWRLPSGESSQPDPRLPALGERWLAPASADDESADEAWLSHRLSLGVAEGRAELGDGETLWLECNAAALNGVSFSKGCYVGQENTSRMNWRKKVNRHLIVVPLEKSDPKRQRAAYPGLGLAVDHLQKDAIEPSLQPDWLQLQ